LIWTKFFGDSLNNVALYLNKDSKENLILCGQTQISFSNDDAFVCKLDTNGTLLWFHSFGGFQNQSIKYIEQTADGGFIGCGYMTDFSGSNDFYILKLDSLGNQQWIGNYGGSFNDYADEVHQTPDGGYVISGDTNSDGAGGYDVEVIRLDSSGSIVWDGLYGDSLQNGSQGILILKHGGYVSYGETQTSNSPVFDFFIQKIDSAGNTVYRQTFGGLNPDAAFSMLEDSDGGFVFTGYSNSYNSGPLNLVIGKTDSLANLLWITSYGANGIDIGYDIIKENNSGYLVVGNTFQNGSDEFYLIHANDSGKVLESSNYSKSSSPVSISPNPTNGLFKILVPSTWQEGISVSIVSLDGTCLLESVNYSESTAVLFFDIREKIKPGLYFIRTSYRTKNYFNKICIQE
jgi:hypothetical protein